MKRKVLSLLLALILCLGSAGCGAPEKKDPPDEQSGSGGAVASAPRASADTPDTADPEPDAALPASSASGGPGLDKDGANAFYKQLSSYDGQGFDVLYADLKDMDADGVPELVVVFSEKPIWNGPNFDMADVDIWQVKDGAAVKSASAEGNTSQASYMGYAANGGKTYVRIRTFAMHQGIYGGEDVFVTVGGVMEKLSESGMMAEDGVDDGLYTRTLNGQTSEITETEYIEYQKSYVGTEDQYGNEEFFLEGGGLTWFVPEETRASYKAVLDQLYDVKDANGSAGSPYGPEYGPYAIQVDNWDGTTSTITFDGAKVTPNKAVTIAYDALEETVYEDKTVTVITLAPNSSAAMSGELQKDYEGVRQTVFGYGYYNNSADNVYGADTVEAWTFYPGPVKDNSSSSDAVYGFTPPDGGNEYFVVLASGLFDILGFGS